MSFTLEANQFSQELQQFNKEMTFSDFNVLKGLGHGAAAFVLQVEYRKTLKKYAIKFYDKIKICNDLKSQLRLQNEIKIHSSLSHPNIIQFFKQFNDDANYYILMELATDGDLYTYQKKHGRLSESEVRFFARQILAGLKYLHSKNIIHRDLKLGNLLLQGRTIKIADFGLAISLTDDKPERDTICGTPNYMSPEIIKHESYGKKIDCWSFGCILYALINGSPPFEMGNTQDVLQKITQCQLPLPQCPISEELKDLLQKTINWDPQDRLSFDQIEQHPFFSVQDIVGENLSFSVEDLQQINNNDQKKRPILGDINCNININCNSQEQKSKSQSKCQPYFFISDQTPLKTNNQKQVNYTNNNYNHVGSKSSQPNKGRENYSSSNKYNIYQRYSPMIVQSQQNLMNQYNQNSSNLIQSAFSPRFSNPIFASQTQLQVAQENDEESNGLQKNYSSIRVNTGCFNNNNNNSNSSNINQSNNFSSVNSQVNDQKASVSSLITNIHTTQQDQMPGIDQSCLDVQNCRRDDLNNNNNQQKKMHKSSVSMVCLQKVMPNTQQTQTSRNNITTAKQNQKMLAQPRLRDPSIPYFDLNRESEVNDNFTDINNNIKNNLFLKFGLDDQEDDNNGLQQLQQMEENHDISSLFINDLTIKENQNPNNMSVLSKVSQHRHYSSLNQQAKTTRRSEYNSGGGGNYGCQLYQNQSKNTSQNSLEPLDTNGLQPIKLKTKNGNIAINQDKNLLLDMHCNKLLFSVQADGEMITILKPKFNISKSYPLRFLPQKYHKLYNYARQVCNTLKSKTPICTKDNEMGKFYLMADTHCSFEAHLKSGIKVYYQLKSKFIKIKQKNISQEIEIHLNSDLTRLPQDMFQAIKVTIQIFSEMLKNVKDQQNQNNL